MAARAADQPGAFGEVLRRYRVAAGLTQEELAERAGLSVRGIADLEGGRRQSPYRETVLRLADALGLGGTEREELLALRRRGVDRTAVPAADPSPHKPQGVASALAPSNGVVPVAPTGWTLQVREASGDERAIPLGPAALTVGRDPDCTLVITSPFVSRQHARIELGPDGPSICDLGSHNGTWLNGIRLQGPQSLRSGDVLTLGDTQIECRAEPMGEPATRTLGAAPHEHGGLVG